MHHGREMGTGRVDGPRGTHHTIRGEDKVGWQEVEGEREEIGVCGQEYGQRDEGERQ